jgi:hypothetical protein
MKLFPTFVQIKYKSHLSFLSNNQERTSYYIIPKIQAVLEKIQFISICVTLKRPT